MSMIYVFEGGSVVYDGSTLTEEQKKRAVAVEKLPEPNPPEGKIAILRANLQTQEVYYEYVDAPKDPEIEAIKNNLADLWEVVLFGGDE